LHLTWAGSIPDLTPKGTCRVNQTHSHRGGRRTITVPLATALPAAASVGPRTFAQCPSNDNGGGCAGYIASGAQFQRITNTAYLRNPLPYAGITNAIGWQDSLRAGTAWNVIVGIRTNPKQVEAPWLPAFLVYHNGELESGAPDTNNAVWCPAPSGGCHLASLGGGFSTGATVTETVTYDRAEAR
jgi:hypothetical protein